MRRLRLRSVLARQWITFGVTLFAGFAAMAVLLLFLLEDQFIDRRLRDVGQTVVEGAVHLPTGFTRYGSQDAPPAVLAAFQAHRPGAIRELRLPDGPYVHVLAGRDQGGRDFLLVYDVSDQLYVNAALRTGWPWLLAIAALLTLAAWVLAHRFVGTLARRADALVHALGEPGDTTGLRQLARDEPIEEFALLAHRSADAWDARLTALERERETLAFLGHELRTPLQSARTSLDALQEDRHDGAAWMRLRRAHQRLVRASQAILWLERDSVRSSAPPTPADTLLAALDEEFAPLAHSRRQALHANAPPGLCWPWPAEVIETIAANLLMNAIQHGGPGTIEVNADSDGLTVVNPYAEDSRTAGFGLGLELVSRLVQRFGGSLSHSHRPDAVEVQVKFRR